MADKQENEDKDMEDILKEYAKENLNDDLHPHDDNADHELDNNDQNNEQPEEEIISPTLSPTKQVEVKKPLKLDAKAVFLRGATSKKEKRKKKRNPFTSEDKISRLERYEEYDRNHPDNQPFPSDENFKGPVG